MSFLFFIKFKVQNKFLIYFASRKMHVLFVTMGRSLDIKLMGKNSYI